MNQALVDQPLQRFLKRARWLLILHDGSGSTAKLEEVAAAARKSGIPTRIHTLTFEPVVSLEPANGVPDGLQDGVVDDSKNGVLDGFGDGVLAVQRMLETQRMGTRVYLCAKAEVARSVVDICRDIGMTDEELWSEVTKQPLYAVFCAGCYHRNPETDKLSVHCHNCGRPLQVSTHYSRRHDAVMGYLFPKGTHETVLR